VNRVQNLWKQKQDMADEKKTRKKSARNLADWNF
jgi:hypothetical protein